MRPNLSVKLGLLIVAVVATTVAASSPDTGSRSRPGTASLDRWHRSEVARIQEHLTGAELLLLNADVSSLSPAQRAARARNVELLRGYREQGVFPRNIHFADTREPYFVDDRGVLCAMAYLVARSGRDDIVENVRATRNNARIRELADDPALVAWLAESGLTAAEATRIQPAYGSPPLYPFPFPERETVSPEYAVASAGTSLLNGMAIAWNFPRGRANAPSSRAGAVAVLTGAAGVALGAPNLGDGGAAAALGSWNVAVGTLAVLAGAHTLFVEPRSRRSSRQSSQGRGLSAPADDHAKRDAVVSIAPTIGPSAGVRLSVIF
ncbi:MAG: hypothetical protein ACR2GJ_07480 [Gemmatimonadaceae bacterium]|jgi:hypothetical protein